MTPFNTAASQNVFNSRLSHQHLWHLADFIDGYNFGRRLKTLKGLTPYEFICKQWTLEQDGFIINPMHQMAGLNTLDCLFRTDLSALRFPAFAPMRRHLGAGPLWPAAGKHRNYGNFAAFDPHHAPMPAAPARLQLSQEQP